MSLLATDGYKLSMAEAGYPLRRETFYFSLRRGGPHVLPFDVRAMIARLLPPLGRVARDRAYLARHAYDLGAASEAAITAHHALEVRAIPRGAWFFAREPVFSITGPSALVSWLEPLVLQLHYRIQVATLALTDPEALARAVAVVTCEDERAIVRETLDAIAAPVPSMRVEPEAYVARVRDAAEALVAITRTPDRLFEVGLRAASCVAQHLLALEGCRAAGVRRTSHVLGAEALDMLPVGTMGHEHVQRFGDDDAAFRAMRDRRPGRSSYLLDTFDTLRSGLPAAFDVMAEDPSRGDSIRFDSGDQDAQLRYAAAEAKRRGLAPVYILEDGFDASRTARFEALREELQIPRASLFYGYGGHLVAQTSGTGLTRDRVAAVYKLSHTDRRSTMKLGDEPGSGKESLPGRPVVFRRVRGEGPAGIAGQEGEDAPEGYALLTDREAPLDTEEHVAQDSVGRASSQPDEASGHQADPTSRLALSPATRALVRELRARAGREVAS